jgi:SPASM domain peptide maturase of grasp-with-spasm system
MNKNFFVLYSDCIPVSGSKRSLICDLGRNDFIFIENSHYNELSNHYVIIDENNKEWLDYLVDEDYGFYTNNPERFPKLTFEYQNTSIIRNAIVEIDQSIKHLEILLKKSEVNRIESIELRVYNNSINFLTNMLSIISKSNIRSVSLCLADYKTICSDFNGVQSNIKILKELFNELKTISIFSCNENESYLIQDTLVVYNKTKLNNNKCGQISPQNFIINFESFTEAKSCNLCLNKKIALDIEGNIKPCPSMNIQIGNIQNFDLKDIADNKVMKDFNIKKDQIEICKDCEFRYICHDCRAYLDPDKINAKPKHCNYNPYTASWE